MASFKICLFYISSVFLSSNFHQKDNQVLNKFITAFDDNTTIQNWLYATNRICLCDSDLFKRVLREISDVLAVINDDKYIDVKSLVLKTDISFENAGNPFFETIYILDSVKRILRIEDQFASTNVSKDEDFSLTEDVLNQEYEEIHQSLTSTIFFIGNDDDEDNELTMEEFDDFRKSESNKKYLSLILKRQLSIIKDFLKTSNDMLESILPVDKKTKVYVESCFEGLECSLKCSGVEIKNFDMEKSTPVLDNNVNMRVECYKRSGGLRPNYVNIEDYMIKTYTCNEIMAKLLIMLFHYYSEIKGKNTKYEIVKNDNEYSIKWSFSDLSLLEPIKQYWLRHELDGYKKEFRKTAKVTLKINSDEVFSIEKSEDTENEPIKTRLILLCCGHQLGAKLIDEFIENVYCKDPIHPKCHVCKKNGVIVGSYDAEVYKYKKSTLGQMVLNINFFLLLIINHKDQIKLTY